jgi:type IV pilus assembly protein PilM
MIGLDIGSKFIKICEVEQKQANYHILTSVIATNFISDQDSDVENDLKIKNRVRAVLNQASLCGKAAALSIGGQGVVSRNFSFPSLGGRELEGAVKLEASQAVFSDISNMYTDFQVLGNTDDGKTEVLFVAVPKEIVDRRMRILEYVDIKPGVMDIDNLALANCYFSFEPSALRDAVVLLNIGHTQTNLCVIEKGKLRFVRNVNFGGLNINKEISSSFGINLGKSENLKKRPDLWNTSGLNIKNILRKSMPDLLEAVYRSIEYCRSRKKLINVDKILITGGSCFTHGIDNFISEVFGINTERWNPLAYTRDEITVQAREAGYYMSVALGLALRNSQKKS